MKTDPIEKTTEYKAIEQELEAKIEKKLEGVRRGHGYCYRYWQAKVEILKNDYGIEWQSPRVLNPRIKFD